MRTKKDKRIEELEARLAHKTKFAESLVSQRDRLCEENDDLKELLKMFNLTSSLALTNDLGVEKTSRGLDQLYIEFYSKSRKKAAKIVGEMDDVTEDDEI